MLQMTEQRRKRLLWSTAFCGFWALAACVLPSKIERAKVLIVIERTSEETDYPRNRQFNWCILDPAKILTRNIQTVGFYLMLSGNMAE